MWVQLLSLKHISIQGKQIAYYPGDFVDIGKQVALSWLADGTARIPEFAVDQTGDMIAPTHIYTNDVAAVQRRLRTLQHNAPILPGDMQLTEQQAVYWHTAINLKPAQIIIGLNFLRTWEIAVPLMDYKTLAAHVGSEEERQATKAVIRDLRVPVYDTRLIFAKRCDNVRKLLEIWYSEPGDRSLSFLRALYTIKPLVLALPAAWCGAPVE